MPFTETVENNLLAVALGQSAYVMPTEVNIALFVSGVEVSGGNYSRIDAIGSFGTPTGGSITNDAVIDFGIASAPWGLIDSFKLFDQNGTEIGNGTITTPRDIRIDEPVRFDVGTLVLNAS